MTMEAAPAVPPTLNAAHFAAIIGPCEVVISIGHTRVCLSTTPPNTEVVPVVEWSASVSMSPTAAQNLHTILGSLLMDYQARFGVIPEDKLTTARVIEVARSALSGAGLQ